MQIRNLESRKFVERTLNDSLSLSPSVNVCASLYVCVSVCASVRAAAVAVCVCLRIRQRLIPCRWWASSDFRCNASNCNLQVASESSDVDVDVEMACSVCLSLVNL